MRGALFQRIRGDVPARFGQVLLLAQAHERYAAGQRRAGRDFLPHRQKYDRHPFRLRQAVRKLARRSFRPRLRGGISLRRLDDDEPSLAPVRRPHTLLHRGVRFYRDTRRLLDGFFDNAAEEKSRHTRTHARQNGQNLRTSDGDTHHPQRHTSRVQQRFTGGQRGIFRRGETAYRLREHYGGAD